MRESIRQLFLLVLVAAGSAAHASFHIWHITQLYSNADGTVQFVELQAGSAGQQYIAGHTLISSQGSTTHSFTFPTNLPDDTAMIMGDTGGYGYGGGTMTTYRSMLIGTQGFAALGGVRPDFVVPNGFLFTNGGTLNYAEASDTINYASLPTDGQMARNRDGTMSAAAPMNFDGMTGSVIAANLPGSLSGLWWDANENGWGVAFTQRRNIIFVAWYTYDANGNPKWYVASNCAMATAGATSGSCSDTLYEVNGPTFFGTPFNTGAVKPTPAGSVSVAFSDANDATLTYTVAGQTRSVAITRQPISSGSIPGANYTDLWWNPAESGWGMAITQQGSVMFLAWYVYDSTGKPMWYVASNCVMNGSGCTDTLYRTTGPAFGPAFDPKQVQAFPAGTVTLSFTDGSNGVLTYTVNGVSGSKAITRQTF